MVGNRPSDRRPDLDGSPVPAGPARHRSDQPVHQWTIDLLQLPDDLTSLHLVEGASVAQVTAAEDGEWLRLSITSGAPGADLPAGLDRSRTCDKR